MKTFLAPLLVFVFCFGVFSSETRAEDGYIYGWSYNADRIYVFARMHIASGAGEELSGRLPADDQHFPVTAAIDTRRNVYTYISRTDEIIRIDLTSGEILSKVQLDVSNLEGLEYSYKNDLFYAWYQADQRLEQTLVNIDPVSNSVSKYPVPEGNVVHFSCYSMFSDRNDWVIPVASSRASYVLDARSGEHLRTILPGFEFGTGIYDDLSDQAYGLHREYATGQWFVNRADLRSGEVITGTPFEIPELTQTNLSNCSFGFHHAGRKYCSGGFSWLIVDVETNDYKIIGRNDGPGIVTHFGKVYNAPRDVVSVRGSVFADQVDNCVRDDSEDFVSGYPLRLHHNGTRIYTRSDGAFVTGLPVGESALSLEPVWPWASACDAEQRIVTVDESGLVDGNLDFGLVPLAIFEHLELSIVSSRAVAGQNIEYRIKAVNKGTVAFNGALRFTHDPLLREFNANPEANRYNGSVAEWDISDLPIGATLHFEVTLTIPADETLRGQELCARVELVNKRDDLLAADREDKICNRILAAYDPNDISVAPTGFGERGLITAEDSTLAYTIRFQNIGDAPARDVVILDTLDEDLDINTLHFGASLHEYSVSLLSGRVLEFRFEDIELPGKEEDEPGSHGAVKYKLDLNTSLPPGTQIHNRAGIYFDFNKPVITNTVVNELAESVTDLVEQADSDKLELRSLGNGLFVCHSVNGLNGRLSVYSILGTKVHEQHVPNQSQVTIDLRSQPSGRYLIRIEDRGQVIVKSVAVLH